MYPSCSPTYAGMSALVFVSIKDTAEVPSPPPSAADSDAAGAVGAFVVDPVVAAAAPLLARVLESVAVVGEALGQTSTELLSDMASSLAGIEIAVAADNGDSRPDADAVSTYVATLAQVQWPSLR